MIADKTKIIEYGDANSAPADLRLRGGLAAKEEEEEDDHCDNSLLALLILPNCLQKISTISFKLPKNHNS